MYFVLVKETEETIAMTRKEENAKWIALACPQECVVRWSAC